MNKKFIFVLGILCLCSASCDLLSSDNSIPIHIETNKKHYNLKTDDSVEVTITNKSKQTIHYSTCLSKTIEVVKKNKIVQTSGLPVCYCLCPAELKPGESMPVHNSSISVKSFQFHNNYRESTEPVEYRIKYSLFFDEAFGDAPVPPEYSRSNTFTITRVDG